MRISRLRLTGIRSFAELEIEFDKAGMHTVLIGKNGTCKTTILRAIAIGLADNKDASGLLAEQNGVLVAEGNNTATIEIDVEEHDTLGKSVTIKTEIGVENGQDVLIKKEPVDLLDGLLVSGYGIARQMEGDESVRRLSHT